MQSSERRQALRLAIAALVLGLPLRPHVGMAAAAAPAGSSAKAKPKAAAKHKPAATLRTSDPAAPPAGGGTPAPPAGSGPLLELKKSNAALKQLLQKQSPTWSPEREARNSGVRKLVGGFLDFEELSRRALARHWDSIPPKQRTEFVQTLRDLVERNYLKQIHGRLDYDLKFEKETRTDVEATVSATVSTASKGKQVTIPLEYKTLWKQGRWVVYDVVTDEQSLLENYRAEFNRIINKEGFDALLGKMKQKLQERAEHEHEQ